jgi:hypothetical protein
MRAGRGPGSDIGQAWRQTQRGIQGCRLLKAESSSTFGRRAGVVFSSLSRLHMVFYSDAGWSFSKRKPHPPDTRIASHVILFIHQ